MAKRNQKPEVRKAQREQAVRAAKEQKKQEYLKRQGEKNEAIKKYKEKKAERFKILNAKTKRGQPKMAGRIELLLAKIEEQCKND